ncbi:unnamed protein product [Caenorhabditis auriculariae]|uniref:C2H2-type domain-containing protein n=1 Tax=Caenorhabditis auriculariae TaxID=2777116 RepID=A0A8S1GYD0_9PELO|nr:unnamed protein product [Caenorhabditis auriculariae]
MEQPIIVNSLLCFVHNFHAKCPRLSHLVAQTFPEKAIAEARDILASRVMAEPLSSPDIVSCYEAVMKKGCNFVFAATNLNDMPMMLVESRSCDTPSGSKASSIDYPMSKDSKSPPPFAEIGISTTSSNEDDGMASEITNNEKTTPVSSLPSPDVKEMILDKISRRRGFRSLDATLKKLTEKRKAKEQVVEGPSMPKIPPHMLPMAPIPLESHPAYFNLLRMMQPPKEPVMSLMDKFTKEISESASRGDQDQMDEKLDERMNELDDMNSSPSPSDNGSGELSDGGQCNSNQDGSADGEADKPFTCEHNNCNKRFANKFLLKKHQFIHTGLRPHTCPYCNKKFNRKDNLLRHKKTHTHHNINEEIRRNTLSETINGLFPIAPQIQFPFQDPLKSFNHYSLQKSIASKMASGTVGSALLDPKAFSALLEATKQQRDVKDLVRA